MYQFLEQYFKTSRAFESIIETMTRAKPEDLWELLHSHRGWSLSMQMIYLCLRPGLVSERKELKESSTSHRYAMLKCLPFIATLLRFYICSWRNTHFWWHWDSVRVEIISEILNANPNWNDILVWSKHICHLLLASWISASSQLWLLTVSCLTETRHACEGMSVFFSSLEIPTFPSTNFSGWVSLQLNLCLEKNQV